MEILFLCISVIFTRRFNMKKHSGMFTRTLYTNEFIDGIIEDYEFGISIDTIIKDYKTDFYKIMAFLKNDNIRLRNISELKKGNKNPMWKGNNVGYDSLHRWIERNKPKIELCENCNKEKSYDLANISGEYKRDIDDYKWLCRRCHMKEDGRINNLKKGDSQGSKNGRAILDEQKVHKIKNLLKENYPRKKLAELFNVNIWVIDLIATNKTWRYV